MPRGQRKPLDEKIQAKQELIIALQKRIDSETKELEELLQQKKYKELQIVSDMMENANLTSDRKSTRLNSSHANESRMPSSA